MNKENLNRHPLNYNTLAWLIVRAACSDKLCIQAHATDLWRVYFSTSGGIQTIELCYSAAEGQKIVDEQLGPQGEELQLWGGSVPALVLQFEYAGQAHSIAFLAGGGPFEISPVLDTMQATTKLRQRALKKLSRAERQVLGLLDHE